MLILCVVTVFVLTWMVFFLARELGKSMSTSAWYAASMCGVGMLFCGATAMSVLSWIDAVFPEPADADVPEWQYASIFMEEFDAGVSVCNAYGAAHHVSPFR